MSAATSSASAPSCEWCGRAHAREQLCGARPAAVSRRTFLLALPAIVAAVKLAPLVEPPAFIIYPHFDRRVYARVKITAAEMALSKGATPGAFYQAWLDEAKGLIADAKRHGRDYNTVWQLPTGDTELIVWNKEA